MGEGFSADEAIKLIGFCETIDQARFLIEHAVTLGPMWDILAESEGAPISESEWLERYKSRTGRRMFLDDFRRYGDWFRDAGLWKG